MVVIGSGAVALEMAQAFAAFGSAVTVLARSDRLLSRETNAASDALRAALEADGVTFLFETEAKSVRTLRPAGEPSLADAGSALCMALSGGSSDRASALLPLLAVSVQSGGGGSAEREIECEALLVATGRRPNVHGLGLEAAGVAFSAEAGIEVDDLCATSNKSIFAVGDCVAGVPRFTHVSGEMAKVGPRGLTQRVPSPPVEPSPPAEPLVTRHSHSPRAEPRATAVRRATRHSSTHTLYSLLTVLTVRLCACARRLGVRQVVVQNALFADAWKLSSLIVPRCVYTDPEVASVGLTPQEAAARGVAVEAYGASLAHNDRAIVEGQAARGGFVEVLCEAGSDKIVGATIVAAHAGEIISEVTTAMQAGMGLGALARVIHPYPTTAEGVMQAGLVFVRKHWALLPPRGTAAAATGAPGS